MKIINVVEPGFPEIESYLKSVERIYKARVVTNAGPLHNELEHELALRFDVPYVSLMANATSALEATIRAMSKRPTVITTPFSFIASASSICMAGYNPKFVDITDDSFNIDPAQVEVQMSDEVGMILGVHCYGFPCNYERLSEIADRRQCPLVFDAAHCFDVFVDGKSVLRYGDASIVSFHGTKVFHTVEGGAVFTKHLWLKQFLDRFRNFGLGAIDDMLGSNLKMSEFHAAMGLASLSEVDNWIMRRRQISDIYDFMLQGNPRIILPKVPDRVRHNYAYYPVRFSDLNEERIDHLILELQSDGIRCRRYFNPSLADYGYFDRFPHGDCPNARRAASNVVCLPLHPNMSDADGTYVTEKVLDKLSNIRAAVT